MLWPAVIFARTGQQNKSSVNIFLIFIFFWLSLVLKINVIVYRFVLNSYYYQKWNKYKGFYSTKTVWILSKFQNKSMKEAIRETILREAKYETDFSLVMLSMARALFLSNLWMFWIVLCYSLASFSLSLSFSLLHPSHRRATLNECFLS